jgi:glycosyltransferase involved in cell wall biosynthesis
MPKNHTVKYMKNAKATLFTTLNNPIQNTSSPNKIFDSFAASKPIIQTTTGWIADLVKSEKVGFNCDPTDPRTMAEAMTTYLTNNQLLKVHSQNAKNLAENTFNFDLMSNNYLNILKSIVS